ncbi:MAG: hypothetical protein WD793_04725 [Steroidobacteraceae bacterium]
MLLDRQQYPLNVRRAALAEERVDGSVGALYWHVRQKHGDDRQPAFRDKFEKALPGSDLKFWSGTIHRLPDQWLIVSVIYPPKQPQESLDLA